MSAHLASFSTLDLFHLMEGYRRKGPTEYTDEDIQEPAPDPYEVFSKSYLPVLNGPIGWLPKVESAITSSVPEELDEEENDGQWLDADSAFNAIHFLNNTADLLPGEPCIYGTPLGDFVAEFENTVARLTSIVSAQRTLLVGVCRANPKEQVQAIIPRGSNRLRDEVREFNNKLAAVHGEAVESAR